MIEFTMVLAASILIYCIYSYPCDPKFWSISYRHQDSIFGPVGHLDFWIFVFSIMAPETVLHLTL